MYRMAQSSAVIMSVKSVEAGFGFKIVPTLVCPYCGEEADMEIGPDEEMPKVVESAKLIQMVRGVEEVEKMDKLLSLAVTGGDFNWI